MDGIPHQIDNNRSNKVPVQTGALLKSRLKHEGARRACDLMIKNQPGTGIPKAMDENTRPLPPNIIPQQGPFLEKRYENNYEVPEGFLFVSRGFLPHASADEEMAALANLPKFSVRDQIDDMISLQLEVKELFMRLGGKLITKSLIAQAKFHGMTYKGRLVENWQDIAGAYKHELEKDLLKPMFEVVFGQWNFDHRMDYIVFMVMQELGLWFEHGGGGSCANQAKLFLKSSFHHLLQNKLRDGFRNNLFKNRRCPHGVKLTVSTSQRKMKRKAGIYNFECNVTGWNEPKHLAWLEKKKKNGEETWIPRLANADLNLERIRQGQANASGRKVC